MITALKRIRFQILAECYKKTENEIERASRDNLHTLVDGKIKCKIGYKISGNYNTITNEGISLT